MKRLAALAMLVAVSLSAHAAVDPDLKPVRVSGLGLGSLPDALKPRLRVRLFLSNDEHDVLPTLPPEDKFRVFATNEVDALPLGGGGADLLDLTGATCPWLGDDPATFWVEGRVHGASACLSAEASLDGSVIGRDSIRIRATPFLVLSNCDVAESLFVSNIGDAPWNAFEADMVAAAADIVDVVTNDVPITFCQDVAEFGWSDLGVFGRPDIWSLDEEAFISLLSSGTGWFARPLANGWGGNIEASPPTALHPHGRIIVGTNLPDHVKAFLQAQEVQTDGGELLELPVSWLRVGHVDEVMAILPRGNGEFSVAVADTDMAVSLLKAERMEIAELVAGGAEDLEAYLDWIDDKLEPFLSSGRQSSLISITNHLAGIRSALRTGLGIPDDAIVPFPVLFEPSAISEGIGSLILANAPNPVNLVALVAQDGRRRLIIPDPVADSLRARICDNLVSNGYSVAEIKFVTTQGPHDAKGEAHCGSNVLRRRVP